MSKQGDICLSLGLLLLALWGYRGVVLEDNDLRLLCGGSGLLVLAWEEHRKLGQGSQSSRKSSGKSGGKKQALKLKLDPTPPPSSRGKATADAGQGFQGFSKTTPKRIGQVGGMASYAPAPKNTVNPDQPPPPPRPKIPKLPEEGMANGGMLIRKRPKGAPLPKLTSSTHRQRNVSVDRKEIEIPAHLLDRLDHLTHDSDVSKRLVKKVAERNPLKDGAWCAEKAIWELERDRY